MRGPNNICTAADRQRWERLITCALTLAAKPTNRGAAEDIRKARDRAVSCVFPDLDPEKIKPFRALLGFADRWRAMDDADRRDNAEALRKLAEACGAILGLGPAPDPHPAAPAVRAQRLPYADDTFQEDAA